MRRTYAPPEVIMETCTGCGLCMEVCPSFVFELMDATAAVVRGDWCIGCGHCGAVCPEEAIRHESAALGKGPRPGSELAITPEQLMLLIRERRSVRNYRRKPVPKKVLERIIEAGRYAPTGSNSQNVRYVVLTAPEEIDKLREMAIAFYERIFGLVRGRFGAFLLGLFAGRRIVENLRESLPKIEHVKEVMAQGEDRLFYQAPVVMVVHAESWDTCSAFNGALALYNCSLMAHTLGIGCCFNGYLQSAVNNSRRIKKWLGIPRDHRCFGAMTLGYQKIRYQRLVKRDPAKVVWR
ncbi:MAG: nitroreductase family protein [Deltaproteobacteria bacterium]|nr:nitroreductase family protein [Deltaproteobacteria bacterium]